MIVQMDGVLAALQLELQKFDGGGHGGLLEFQILEETLGQRNRIGPESFIHILLTGMANAPDLDLMM
jgi:hypothetical protein